MDVLAGFEPLVKLRTSPFLDHVGPFFYRWQEKRLVLGLRIAEKHANARGTAHGGLLLTMAAIRPTGLPSLRARNSSLSAWRQKG